MKPLYKGLLLALLHLAIVCSLGAKLLYDRASRPRMWMKVASYDPDLPIRGRYLSINLDLPFQGMYDQPYKYAGYRCDLVVENNQLIARLNENGEFWVPTMRTATNSVIVSTRMAYFLPESATDPSRRSAGEELWVEATIPRKGPPRPIRLGIKKDGTLTPLVIH
jgi:hypothetical protein